MVTACYMAYAWHLPTLKQTLLTFFFFKKDFEVYIIMHHICGPSLNKKGK